MANLARFNPFDDPLEDLFRGFFVRPMSLESRTAVAPAQFRMDVTETDGGYRVLADIPGARKDDINVTINGNEIAVTAEVKNEKDVRQGDKLLRSERYYGKLYRAFTLGQDVDESGAQAKYADGVLELTLPKKAVVTAKKLAVH
jgi:HSP20 family protein